MTPRITMLLLPLAVLALSRLGADVSVRLLPMHIAWIPAFVVYYLAIEASVIWVRRKVPGASGGLSFSSGARPATRRVIFGVVLPGLLPLGFFVLNVSLVPPAVLGAIAWMWFYLRERRLLYTIASHFVADVFNLSVAMFMGLRLRTV